MKNRNFFLLILLSGLFIGIASAQPPVQEWVATYTGAEDFEMDMFVDITCDANGYVYMTGSVLYLDTGLDYITVKYDIDGTEEWVAYYRGTDWAHDEAINMSVDQAGNVYVTGYSYSPSTGGDFLTVKYDSSGVEQWASSYNGPGNDIDVPSAIEVDEYGNVYVTGYCTPSGSSEYDYLTVKYDSNGVEQWSEFYDGPSGGEDVANDMVLDNYGNVYVTGYSYMSSTYMDCVTIKYDTDGVEQWVAVYDGPNNLYDAANAIAIDSGSSIYITGYRGGTESSSYHDFVTVKYDCDGNEQWVAYYNGDEDMTDEANAITIDSSDNVLVTGKSWGDGTGYDCVVVKYNNDGAEQWVARYDAGTGAYEDIVRSIAVDESGNSYICGYAENTVAPWRTIFVTKYDPDGSELWEVNYNGTANEHAEAYDVALDQNGCVYVTGFAKYTDTYQDCVTIKYSQPLGTSPSSSVRNTPQLLPITPNPSYEIAKINYYLPNSASVKIEIFDISGRLVEVIDCNTVNAGNHSTQISCPTSGLYICLLRSGDFELTETFIVLAHSN